MRFHPLLRTGTGRLRLIWRLLLFLGLGAAFTVAVAPLFDGGGIGMAAWAPLLAAVAAGVLLLRMDDRPAEALGFHLGPSALREAGLGLFVGVVAGLAAVAAVAAVGGVAWSGEGGTPGGYLASALSSLAFFVGPAAAEEAVFRGYPFQALVEVVGVAPSLVAVSGFFGALHAFNPGATVPGVLNTALAGLVLSLLLLRTGSLWWASGAHLGWNWAHGFVADMSVSGLDLVDAPYLVARPRGPEWISGGVFGPEGSVLTTCVLAGAAVWTWRTDRLRPAEAVARARPLALLRRGGGTEARDASDPPRDGGRR